MTTIRLYKPRYYNKVLASKNEIKKCFDRCKNDVIPIMKNDKVVGAISDLFLENNCIYGKVKHLKDSINLKGFGVATGELKQKGSRSLTIDMKLVYYKLEDEV